MREIWLIFSNFLEFSVDGSENSELDVDEFLCKIRVICGRMEQISLDSLEFPRVLCRGRHLKHNV